MQMEEAGSQSQTPDPLGHKQGLEEGWGGPWHPTPLRRRPAHLPQAAHPSVSSAPGSLGSSRSSSSNNPLSRAGQLLGLAPWGLTSLVLGGSLPESVGLSPRMGPCLLDHGALGLSCRTAALRPALPGSPAASASLCGSC